MYPSLAATLSPPTLWCRTAIPKNLHSRPNISSPGEKLGLPVITQLREQPAEPSKLVSLHVPPRVLSLFLGLYLPIHIYIPLFLLRPCRQGEPRGALAYLPFALAPLPSHPCQMVRFIRRASKQRAPFTSAAALYAPFVFDNWSDSRDVHEYSSG